VQEIKIWLKNKWNFEFDTGNPKIILKNGRICPYCNNTPLDSTYCYIIDSLKKAGLLDKNYKEICCCCNLLKRFGLLYLRHKLIGFLYSEELDILLIEVLNFPIYFLPSTREEKAQIILRIRIHDFSKVKLF